MPAGVEHQSFSHRALFGPGKRAGRNKCASEMKTKPFCINREVAAQFVFRSEQN